MKRFEGTQGENTTSVHKDDAKPKAPASAYVKMAVVGLGAACLISALAMVFRQDNPWLTFAVFAGCTIGPCLALSWFVFVSKYTVIPDKHAAESVESRWYERAASGAFHDMLLACGLGLTVLSVTRMDFTASNALMFVLILCGVDTLVRYRVISRREA